MNANKRRSDYNSFINIFQLGSDTRKNAPAQSPLHPCASPNHLSGQRVWGATLKSPGRGELEITDVNNEYIRQGAMGYSVLDGYWSDAGTFESLLRAGGMVERYREKKE